MWKLCCGWYHTHGCIINSTAIVWVILYSFFQFFHYLLSVCNTGKVRGKPRWQQGWYQVTLHASFAKFQQETPWEVSRTRKITLTFMPGHAGIKKNEGILSGQDFDKCMPQGNLSVTWLHIYQSGWRSEMYNLRCSIRNHSNKYYSNTFDILRQCVFNNSTKYIK